jgi:hypothetical protein
MLANLLVEPTCHGLYRTCVRDVAKAHTLTKRIVMELAPNLLLVEAGLVDFTF